MPLQFHVVMKREEMRLLLSPAPVEAAFARGKKVSLRQAAERCAWLRER
jgi:hypothetical protein